MAIVLLKLDMLLGNCTQAHMVDLYKKGMLINTCNNLKEYIQLRVLSYHENFISIINKRLLCQVLHFPSNCKVT